MNPIDIISSILNIVNINAVYVSYIIHSLKLFVALFSMIVYSEDFPVMVFVTDLTVPMFFSNSQSHTVQWFYKGNSHREETSGNQVKPKARTASNK